MARGKVSSSGYDLSGSRKRFFETSSRSDGPGVTWEWVTRDVRTGTVTINGTTYDAAAGRVFLIATRGGQVRVRQVLPDLAGFRAQRASFLALVDGNPEIAHFVAASSEAE
jgi:hypothetical protein